MTPEKIIRAWKDPSFRERLEAEQRAELPENPAGTVELEDGVLEAVAAAMCVSYDNCNINFCHTEGNPFTLGACCAEDPGGGSGLSSQASPSQPGGCPSGAMTSFCGCL